MSEAVAQTRGASLILACVGDRIRNNASVNTKQWTMPRLIHMEHNAMDHASSDSHGTQCNGSCLIWLTWNTMQWIMPHLVDMKHDAMDHASSG
eukprot:1156309-Pelagomonas_calceolata.AAC.11